jgi:hypothetical protein
VVVDTDPRRKGDGEGEGALWALTWAAIAMQSTITATNTRTNLRDCFAILDESVRTNQLNTIAQTAGDQLLQ